MSTYDNITFKVGLTTTDIRKPENFMPEHEDVYAGEYTTCTGAIIADRIGWKFADMTLEWGALPQSAVDVLVGLSGTFKLKFDDMDGTYYEETAIRDSIISLRNRNTINGVTYWKNVSLKVRFIDVH